MNSMEKRMRKFEKQKRKRNKPAKKTSNVVLAVIGSFLFTFIVSMEVIFCVKGAVPDTLIQYTLGAGGVEAVLLAAIKISKLAVGENATVETEENTNGYC